MDEGFYIKIDETVYYKGIESGSMRLREMLFDRGNIEFCTFCANRFEVTLFGVEDVSGQPIEVTYVDENEHTTYIFSGWVDTAKRTDGGEYREIIAYDALYKYRDVDVIGWWNDFWEHHITSNSQDVLKSLLAYMTTTYGLVCGFTLDNVWSLGMTRIEGLQSATFGYMLTQLALGCGIKGVFTIDRLGRLNMIGYPNAGAVMGGGQYIDIRDNVQTDSTYEEFVTPKLDMVKLMDATGQVGITAGSGASQIGTYVIKPSICFMNASTQTLGTLVGPYLGELSANMLSYKPARINLIRTDFNIHLGNTVRTDQGYHFVTGIEFSGPQLVNQTIISTGAISRDDVASVDIPITDTAASLIKKINLSADEIKLSGDKIILDGATSFNDNVTIGLDGILRAVGAVLTNMDITSGTNTQKYVRVIDGDLRIGSYSAWREDVTGGHYNKTAETVLTFSSSHGWLEKTVNSSEEWVPDSGPGYSTATQSTDIIAVWNQGKFNLTIDRLNVTNGNINLDNGHGLYGKYADGAYRGLATTSGSNVNFATGGYANTVVIGSSNTNVIKADAPIRVSTPIYYDNDKQYPQYLEVGRGTNLPAGTNLNTIIKGGTYYIGSGADLNTMSGTHRILSFMGAGACRLDVIHSVSGYSSQVAIIQRMTSQWGNGTYERELASDGKAWTDWKCVVGLTKRGTVAAKSGTWTNLVSGFLSSQGGDAYDISVSMPRGYARYVFHYGTAWSGQRYVSIGSNLITLRMSGATLQIQTQADTTDSFVAVITPLF